MRLTEVFVVLAVMAPGVVGFWGGFDDGFGFDDGLGVFDPTIDLAVLEGGGGAQTQTEVVTDPADPPIVFKRVDTHEWVYDDGGTGADSDVSIWRPTTTQYDYYAVGDVAVACHCAPSTSSIMVKERHSGSLAAPTGFTEIWNDGGSGGSHDVRIMRMDPPTGFTCLGYVAVLGHGSTPDANKYRCVHNSYVSTTGRYDAIWLDHGSGADSDVGLWGNRVSEQDTYALDSNAFTAFATHNTPSGSPPMMNGRHVINHQLVVPPSLSNYVFTLFQVTDLDEVWKDSGSGAGRDFHSWRARGRSDTYSLGDHGVGYRGRPAHGFVAKAHQNDALQLAYDWVRVWKDSGSGADWDGAFWRPLCPSGYRGLGHVMMRNHWEKPPSSDFRCVKVDYTLGGAWDWVWNDGGSGADADVTVWRAVASGKGQGVDAISAIAHHGDMNVGAYVLNPDYVNYVLGEPPTQYILQDITYLFDDRSVTSRDPDSLSRTILYNHGSTEQTATREISYTYEETYSWGNTAGLEIGVTTAVTAGVPGIGSASVSTSVTASYSHEWGGSQTKSHTDTISVQTTVQPHSSKAALITGSLYTADVPYTATLRTVYADGSSSTRNSFSGVYRGVQISEVHVVYEEDIPLTTT